MDFRVVGSNLTFRQRYAFTAFPLSSLKNALPDIPRKRNPMDNDTPASISDGPAIPPLQGVECDNAYSSWGRQLVSLSAFYQWSNGLLFTIVHYLELEYGSAGFCFSSVAEA